MFIKDYMKPYYYLQTNDYNYMGEITWNHILVFDRNTWNYIIMTILFVLDKNTWHYIIANYLYLE